MIALRMARALYDGAAIDEAIAAYAAHANIERADDASHFVVNVTSKREGAERERRLVGELANWALGVSIQRARRTADPRAGDAR